MMKRPIISLLAVLAATVINIDSSRAQIANTADITRIIETLAADDMRGRASFSPDIAKAADFIASEFKTAGLKPYAEDNYRQTFAVKKVATINQQVSLDSKPLEESEFIMLHVNRQLQWSADSAIQQLQIAKGEDFSMRFREIVLNNPDQAIVWVDPSFASQLARFKKIYSREDISPAGESAKPKAVKVFILAEEQPQNFQIQADSKTQEFPLFNVAAVIPGKSKAQEYIIFSSHYDHIGILPAVEGDSIANGADDNASGTTAMISLAKYYKNLDQNERTLIFVAFTAEEIGMFGSKYFSTHIDADKVVAMINIEMIGKDSKFGPNSLYITGYNNSNLGPLMQENVKGTAFTFNPDPYPQQNLFYRSDNAVLAALGVPAHTFSTSQIDKDTYYHTVKDELKTLDIENIKSSIEAIAKGALGLITGKQTPARVEKLQDN